MSKYIPEGGLDPLTFQNVMDAANIKYYLAKVRLSGNGTYLPAYLPACLPAYLPTYLPTYLPAYLPTYLPAYLPITNREL